MLAMSRAFGPFAIQISARSLLAPNAYEKGLVSNTPKRHISRPTIPANMAGLGVEELMASLEQMLPQDTRDNMRRLGFNLHEGLTEMGFDEADMEAMLRDPISMDRMTDGPKPPTIPLDDARAKTDPMRVKILELYGSLRDIVARHEATIQRRWAKKTKQERLAIILQAWPDMPRGHRPDFSAFKDEYGFVPPAARARWRTRALCPTINQEDLVKPRTLPLLLNSRGRNHPSVFAGTDRSEMSIGLRSFALVPFSTTPGGYVVLLNRINDTTTEDYGKIVPRSIDGSTVGCTTTSHKQYTVGEGALILEAQTFILSFLVETCKAILHEIPLDMMTDPQYPILPEPKIKEESESSGFESLTVLAQEAPYRLPTYLDTGRMVSLLTARAQAAKDHLWSLREDPRYFYETLLEYAEHRNEYFWGNPDGTDGRSKVYWPSEIATLLIDAYRAVESFEELRRQAVELQDLQAKYSAQIDPSKDLPKEYMEALILFRTHLWQNVGRHFRQLEDSSFASPPMRHMFEYGVAEESIVSNPARIGDLESYLIWLFKTLYEDGEHLKTLGLTMVMDELDHLISTDPKAKALISRYIGEVIGDLSILSQCYRQLELYQPWAQDFDREATMTESKMKGDYLKWIQPQEKIVSAVRRDNLKAAAKLANPDGRRYPSVIYPIDKRRTRENVEKLRKAEADLDAFWSAIDKLINLKYPGMQGSVSGPFLAQSRLLKRTPEWVEPEPQPTSRKKKAGKQQEAVQEDQPDTEDKPLSSFYFAFEHGGGTTPSRRPELPSTKTKTKTKGVANTPEALATTTETTPQQPEPQMATLPVDPRAFKVFRTLFFNPDVTSSPGEIPWKDFLHAMSCVGFVAEKLYGSVWQFRPSSTDLKVEVWSKQAIQFHEPHPSPKIGFTTARWIGRRLHRQYGWVGGMFVLKK